MTMAVGQQRSFKVEVEQQARDSFKILEQMQKEGVLCDVTLVVGDVEIPAHKTILASCSPHFYSMFTNFETAKQERIPLDVDPQILLSIVNYMYTSKLTVTEQSIIDLLKASKMLTLNAVLAECGKILERILRPNNCFLIKSVAVQYWQLDLLDKVWSYIDENFVDILASDEFLCLTGDEVSELISRDTLKVSSEEKVYEFVARWISHNQKGRLEYLRLLMGHVRFGFISKYYLKQRLVEDTFFTKDTYCLSLKLKPVVKEDGTVVPKIKPRRYEEIGNVLLVVGGISEEAGNSLEYYNITKKCWSEVLEIPSNVYNFSLVVINQKLYIIGGIRDNKTVTTVNCYDINTNKCEMINDLTVRRNGYAVAVLDNCIYAMGGYNGNCLNCVEKFDFQTQKWRPVAPMLKEKWLLGAGVLDHTLYVVGGIDHSRIALKTVDCYNPRTNTWKELNSIIHPRWGLGICTLDGRLYAIGGCNKERYLSCVEEYNPDTDNWRLITPMKVERAFFGVTVVNNIIYVTGGTNDNGSLNSVEVYDKVTNSWTILPQAMNVARSGHSAVLVNKT